jgi:hypothetical protein
MFVSHINDGIEQNYDLAEEDAFTATCKRNLGVDVDHQKPLSEVYFSAVFHSASYSNKKGLGCFGSLS